MIKSKQRLLLFARTSAFRLILGTGLCIFSLYFTLRFVSIKDVWSVLKTAKAGYIFLILCSVNLNTVVKAIRWHTIIKGTRKDIPFKWTFYAFSIGQMMNWIYPARMGDLGRVLLLGRKEAGEAFAAGTLVLEKLLDAVYFVGLIFILPLFLPVPAWLIQPIATSLFLTLGAVFLVGVLLITGRSWVTKMMDKNFQIPMKPALWMTKFLQHLESGLRSLEVLRRRRDFILLNLLTIIVWLTAAANVIWSFRALSLPFHNNSVTLAATLLVMISIQLGIAVPAVPGRIGVFELICVLALSVFAVSEPLSLGFGILLHSLVMGPIILVGLASLLLMSAGQPKGFMKGVG